MYRFFKPPRHYRYEGKRHGRAKRAVFSFIPSRPKSLLTPGFGGIGRSFERVFVPHLPCFSPGTALGGVPGAVVTAESLFTPSRYGENVKLSVFPSYRSGFFTLSNPALLGDKPMSYELNNVVRQSWLVPDGMGAVPLIAASPRVEKGVACFGATPGFHPVVVCAARHRRASVQVASEK